MSGWFTGGVPMSTQLPLDVSQPPELATPALVVWAAERIGPPGDMASALTELARSVAEAPGNHFTLIERHAETTAEVVEEWLSSSIPTTVKDATQKEK